MCSCCGHHGLAQTALKRLQGRALRSGACSCTQFCDLSAPGAQILRLCGSILQETDSLDSPTCPLAKSGIHGQSEEEIAREGPYGDQVVGESVMMVLMLLRKQAFASEPVSHGRRRLSSWQHDRRILGFSLIISARREEGHVLGEIRLPARPG
jgi:hypothetical protein